MSTAALTLPSKRSSVAPDEGDPSRPLTATAPLGYAGGDANLYRYCGNGPTDRVDPTGQLWFLDGRVYISATWVDASGTSHQFSGEGAPDLRALLGTVSRVCGKLRQLTLKGHGMIFGKGFAGVLQPDFQSHRVWWVHSASCITKFGEEQDVDIGNTLRCVTDAETRIDLNGCGTAGAAYDLAKILNNGATVSGFRVAAASIPGTMSALGWPVDYSFTDEEDEEDGD
jgi:hypothetical protein